jgi:hypothetical protein
MFMAADITENTMTDTNWQQVTIGELMELLSKRPDDDEHFEQVWTQVNEALGIILLSALWFFDSASADASADQMLKVERNALGIANAVVGPRTIDDKTVNKVVDYMASLADHILDTEGLAPATRDKLEQSSLYIVDDTICRIEIVEREDGWFWQTRPFGTGGGPFTTRAQAEAHMRATTI